MRIWKNKKGVFAHRFWLLGALLFAAVSVHAKGPSAGPVELNGPPAMPAMPMKNMPSGMPIGSDIPAPMPGKDFGPPLAQEENFDLLPEAGKGQKGMPPPFPPKDFGPMPELGKDQGMPPPMPGMPPPPKDFGPMSEPGNDFGPMPMPGKGAGLPPMPPPGRGIDPPPMNANGPSIKPMPTKGPGLRPAPGMAPPPMPPKGKGMGGMPMHGRRTEVGGDAAEVFKVVPQVCVPAKGKFTWNFEKERLYKLIQQVSDLLCLTIVINTEVNQNEEMTIIGKSLLTPKDALDVLLSSMAAKGITMVEQNKVWMVVKKAEAKKFATPIYTDGSQARDNEGVGTFFYKANHASIESLKTFARALITKDGLVESLGNDTIIVIDTNSNIRRLGGFFSYADIVDAENKVRAIKLIHADAKTVEKQLRELFDLAAGGRRGKRRRGEPGETGVNLEIEKIISDERLNSLIVIGDKDSVTKLNETVALFDQPDSAEGNKGKIHVKDLRFADAKEISETLNSVVQQDRGRRRFPRGPGPGPMDGPSSSLFESDVKVTAHEDTNKIVILATANDYKALLPTIDALDVRKKQVYVEVAVLDISVNNNTEFGLGLFSGLPGSLPGIGSGLGVLANPGGGSIVSGMATALGGTGANVEIPTLGNKSAGALAVLGNFLQGGFGWISTSGDSPIPSVGAFLKALAQSSQVDVLSTPYLLTTDNKEAEMSVGEKVPVIRGASTLGAGGLGMPIQNIAHEDVKLTFKITPHVGEGGVRLDVFQEVNDIGGEEQIFGQKQYRIRTKNVKSTIVLKDQQTGVIGGLMSHTLASSENKTPFLGDIPILGHLFKSTTTDKKRKSLVLVITPYVIESDDDYKKILDRKMKEREEFARLYYGGKIKNYDAHKDYDKISGPVTSMLKTLDSEMTKTENGGSGSGDETVISPKKEAEKTESSFDAKTMISPIIEPSKSPGSVTEPELELEPLLPKDDKKIQFDLPKTDKVNSNDGNLLTPSKDDKAIQLEVPKTDRISSSEENFATPGKDERDIQFEASQTDKMTPGATAPAAPQIEADTEFENLQDNLTDFFEDEKTAPTLKSGG